jgi:hypothetical protein
MGATCAWERPYVFKQLLKDEEGHGPCFATVYCLCVLVPLSSFQHLFIKYLFVCLRFFSKIKIKARMI